MEKIELPNADAEAIIDSAAEAAERYIRHIESVNLTGPLSYEGSMRIGEMKRPAIRAVENIAWDCTRQCALRKAGTNYAIDVLTPEQHRYIYTEVWNRAYKLAEPHIEGERDLVLGPDWRKQA